jgi:hypothetical protein
MLLADFCNRLTTRAPDGSIDSRGGHPACAWFTTSDGDEPQRTTRVTTCLTTRHELRPTFRCTRPPMRWARMPPDPAGLPIDIEPTGDTPRPRRCLPRTGRTNRPLTPMSRCACAEARHAPPGPPSPPTRSKSAIPTTRASSIDECPLDQPRLREAASNADPPPIPRLCRLGPASDALSPHAPGGGGARQGRFRAFITPGRTLPRAARRLLQSKQSASTTDGPSKPRSPVRPLDSHRVPYLGAGPARGVEWPREQSPFRRPGVEDSRVRGRFGEQKARAIPLRPLPPRLLAVEALPQPDRLSDTSRRTARLRAGWSRRHAPGWASEPSI